MQHTAADPAGSPRAHRACMRLQVDKAVAYSNTTFTGAGAVPAPEATAVAPIPDCRLSRFLKVRAHGAGAGAGAAEAPQSVRTAGAAASTPPLTGLALQLLPHAHLLKGPQGQIHAGLEVGGVRALGSGGGSRGVERAPACTPPPLRRRSTMRSARRSCTRQRVTRWWRPSWRPCCGAMNHHCRWSTPWPCRTGPRWAGRSTHARATLRGRARARLQAHGCPAAAPTSRSQRPGATALGWRAAMAEGGRHLQLQRGV